VDLRRIYEQRGRIDNLFKSLPSHDDNFERQAHWARYLCVCISGYLEVSIRELLGRYAEQCASKSISSYVWSQLKFFKNPKMEPTIQLVSSFDSDWGESLKKFAEDERGDAVNSIVSNRHEIAHGIDVGITIARLHTWYEKSNEVLDFLMGLCK
jgi:hypothetical protein